MRESVIYQEIFGQGEQKGRQEGRQEAMQQVVLNLLREGMAKEQIAKVTELSIEEVEILQQE